MKIDGIDLSGNEDVIYMYLVAELEEKWAFLVTLKEIKNCAYECTILDGLFSVVLNLLLHTVSHLLTCITGLLLLEKIN